MSTTVHHLDCCTMCPLAGRWLNQDRHMVAHCLLVETERDGLVLVDAGIGSHDVADPSRLGRVFTSLVRPQLEMSRTAAAQVERLGFSTADVRHVVVTHLDVDHAGGLADFPDATVHVVQAELDAALHPRLRDRERYRQVHWAHGPRWQAIEGRGEPWMGFEGVRTLDGLDTEVRIVPMWGHTRGHVLVGVPGGDRTWLHCGDAYFHEHVVDPARPGPGPVLRFFEMAIAADARRVAENHGALRHVALTRSDRLDLFSAHDPRELARARLGSAPNAS
jgi:glyoxylase-like metal-dependent hydrolase (beta-lactamase superfamily II)